MALVWGDSSRARSRRPALTPAVSVRREDGALTYSLEIADLKPEELEVSVSPGVLTVRGEHRLERTFDREGSKWRRISSSSFSRSLALPDNTQWSSAEAFFEAGVLRITVPEGAPGQPQSIPVSYADEAGELLTGRHRRIT